MTCKLHKVLKGAFGTIEFEAQFQGMRKSQDWVVYPPESRPVEKLTIQSDTRIGQICLESGKVFLSKPKASGTCFADLAKIALVGTLASADISQLQQVLRATPALGATRIA